MSKKYWLGQSTAVAKVITLTVANASTGETFSISVGGVEIASYTVLTGGVEADVVDALVSAWNSSTNPYATPVTAGDGGDSITLTADTAGVDFDATPSVDVSSAATFEKSVTTALAGPNVWSDGDNWYDVDGDSVGVAPITGDDVIVSNGSVNICWGIDQSAVLLASLRVDLTYTGRIGLRSTEVATSADGETYDSTPTREYRERYLKIGATRVDLGKRLDTGTPNGSRRIKLDNQATGAQTTVVHQTGNVTAETGLPAVRLLFNSASAALYVNGARAGVGIAVDEPGNTSTLSSVSVTPSASSDRVLMGEGVSVSTYRQNDGDNVLQCSTYVGTVTVDGGTLTTKGDFTLGALTANGGTVVVNHINSSSGNEVDTLALGGGTVDFTQSEEPRQVGTLNPDTGTLRMDSNVVTISTWNEATGQRTVGFSA